MDIYNEQTQNTEEPLEQEPLHTFAKTTDLFRYCLIWKGQLHKLYLKMRKRVKCAYMILGDSNSVGSQSKYTTIIKKECLRKGNRSSVRLEQVLKEVSLARLNPTLTSKEES